MNYAYIQILDARLKKSLNFVSRIQFLHCFVQTATFMMVDKATDEGVGDERA